MKLRLLDILACPVDKTWPLEICSFEEKNIENVKMPKQDEKTNVVCSYYCGKNDKILFDEKKMKVTIEATRINYYTDCKECLTKEIVSGILYCPKCKDYYPIAEDIPMMLKIELRNEDVEREFNSKWALLIKEYLEKK